MRRFLHAFKLAWQSRKWEQRPDWTPEDEKQVRLFLNSNAGRKMTRWIQVNWQTACESSTFDVKGESLTYKAGCANGIKICLINLSLLSEDREAEMVQDSTQEDSAASILRRR